MDSSRDMNLWVTPKFVGRKMVKDEEDKWVHDDGGGNDGHDEDGDELWEW